MAQQFPPQMLASALSPSKGFGAPPLAPDVLAQQQRVQQHAMLAQSLLNQEPLQGQMVSGHYVPPNPLQGLARALQTYAGYRTMADLPQEQAKLQQTQQQALEQKLGFVPNASGTALAANGGVRTDAVTPEAQAFASALRGGAPMLLPGVSEEQSRMALHLLGPEKYLTAYLKQFEPTSEQRNLGHLPAEQRNQILEAQYLQDAAKDGVRMIRGADGQIYAVPVEGYAQSQAALRGGVTAAEEAAKASFDLVEVPDGRGGTRMMPRSQAVESLGAPATPTPQSTGLPPGALGQAPSPASQAAATALNNNWVSNSYQPAIDNANSSRNLVNTIEAMRRIPLETGFGAEFKGMAANLLTSLGVENAANVATDTQKFQSLAMDRLQTELMKQKGPQTEGDAQRAAQTFAKLSNTQEANKFIFDFAQAKANMDIRKADFYERALPLAQQQGDLTEIDRRWRKLQGSIWDDPLLVPYREQ